jgi:hypothetical protein
MAANTVQDDPEDSMSCAYRTHRYRASVTAHPASVSWNHAHHPIALHPLVVRPKRQAVTATADAIPASLVQCLWAQWHQAPPEGRESVARLVGDLMRSPRWHWDVTVLPDHSLPDPQHPFVTERAGRPTIGMPIAMLREIWKQVVADVNQDSPTMPPIMQRFVSITDPALWQEFWQEVCALRKRARRPKKRFLQRELYGYLSPQRLPAILPEIRRLLRSNDPDDRYTALTVLTRWLASPDHETRTVAAQMLHGWPHVVATIVRSHPSNDAICTMLDRLVPTILTATRPDDRAAWVTTLWKLVTNPLNGWRRQTSADALRWMMTHDPMVVSVVRNLLRAHLSPQCIMTEPMLDPLLKDFMRTPAVDEMLEIIDQAIHQAPNTIARFNFILAAGWGNGHDHRILQIIDSIPGPHWKTVLIAGITASVGDVVCDRIGSWFPRGQAITMIVNRINAREERGDWPLEPLPEHLIPWVGEAARICPYALHPTTIRRLWLANPEQAWNVTQTMLGLSSSTVRAIALAAMDAGWGTGHDAEVATTLRARILEHQDGPDSIETGTTAAVAGIGRAVPAIIESLLTELAMQGNENVQRKLISALRRGWGHGQDDLVMRIMEIIAKRDPSDVVWVDSGDTLTQAWHHLPPQAVVHLIDWLLTRTMARSVDGTSVAAQFAAEGIIPALVPGWTYLPAEQVIERIAHHVAHLHAHARTLDSSTRDRLVAAWASVIAAGMERSSAADIHALLSLLWTISPHSCTLGMKRLFQ